MAKEKDEIPFLTPEEQERADYIAGVHHKRTSHMRISTISFIFAVLVAFLLNVVINLLVLGLGLTILVLWFILIAVIFFYSYGHMTRNRFAAYLFIIWSTIGLGATGAFISLIFTGGIEISVLASFGGTVFAYFKLEGHDML